MTAEQKIIRAKVGVLGLAKPLGNGSKPYQLMGNSRDSFHRFNDESMQNRGRPTFAVH